jgi:hypothetical protein
MRSQLIGFASAVIILATGCVKQPELPAKSAPQPPTPAPAAEAAPVSSSQAAPETTQAAAPAPEDKLPTAPPNSSVNGPVERPLTEALQRYVEATGKMPADFNALIKANYIKQLPALPPGKHFAIDRRHMQVVIVGQ